MPKMLSKGRSREREKVNLEEFVAILFRLKLKKNSMT